MAPNKVLKQTPREGWQYQGSSSRLAFQFVACGLHARVRSYLPSSIAPPPPTSRAPSPAPGPWPNGDAISAVSCASDQLDLANFVPAPARRRKSFSWKRRPRIASNTTRVFPPCHDPIILRVPDFRSRNGCGSAHPIEPPSAFTCSFITTRYDYERGSCTR